MKTLIKKTIPTMITVVYCDFCGKEIKDVSEPGKNEIRYGALAYEKKIDVCNNCFPKVMDSLKNRMKNKKGEIKT